LPIAFTVRSTTRIVSVGIASGGFPVHVLKWDAPYDGAGVGLLGLKAAGVPPGDYPVTVFAYDETGCYASTGALRIARVTP